MKIILWIIGGIVLLLGVSYLLKGSVPGASSFNDRNAAPFQPVLTDEQQALSFNIGATIGSLLGSNTKVARARNAYV